MEISWVFTVTGWWFQTFLFSIIYIYGIILPIDELKFFKTVQTTNQITIDRLVGGFICCVSCVFSTIETG